MGHQLTKGNAFGTQADPFAAPRRSGPSDQGVPLPMQVAAHLARECLDQRRTEEIRAVALVGQLDLYGMNRRIRELGPDEDVGREVSTAADDRLVVAARARVGVRSAGPEKQWVALP